MSGRDYRETWPYVAVKERVEAIIPGTANIGSEIVRFTQRNRFSILNEISAMVNTGIKFGEFFDSREELLVIKSGPWGRCPKT